MAQGSDKSVFSQISIRNHFSKKGRPEINRELAYRLIQAGYSTYRIRRILKCSDRAIRLIRKEMQLKGLSVQPLDIETVERGLRDFDQECVEAVGISFKEWLKTKLTDRHQRQIFSFCKNVWEKVWDKPSLSVTKDVNMDLADKLAMQFLSVFQEDTRRLRRRKKMIRYLFRFLGRGDICDRYLSMAESREPTEIRELPQIMFLDFPDGLEKCIRELPNEMALAVKLKIITQMRTGGQERELMGIKVGEANSTYLIMRSPQEFIFRVKAKAGEKWVVNWLGGIANDIYSLYKARRTGQYLFSFDIVELRKLWREVTKEVLGFEMTLHDLRKVAITWLWVCGIPLEIACDINVGWKDLNTAKKHYLTARQLIKRTDREKYKEKIPEWFKQGLEEYA